MTAPVFTSDPTPVPGCIVPPSLDGRAPSVAETAAEALATLREIKALLTWLRRAVVLLAVLNVAAWVMLA